jgi:hypothetical protein
VNCQVSFLQVIGDFLYQDKTIPLIVKVWDSVQFSLRSVDHRWLRDCRQETLQVGMMITTILKSRRCRRGRICVKELRRIRER